MVKGLTTNPSLMKKSGVKNYTKFLKKFLKKLKNQSHLKYLLMKKRDYKTSKNNK